MEIQELYPSSTSLLSLVKTSSKSKFYARVTLAIFLLMIPFFLCAPWQQTVLGTGRVVASAALERQQFIEAPIEGRITKWYVIEGC